MRLVIAGPALALSVPALSQTHSPPDSGSLKALGSKSAPITVEVFSDYQCPSCRVFYEQTLRPMINDYVASGKVYLVHRDFPLPMHAYSRQAARWANAAARIGKFEEVDAALYNSQPAWSADGNIQKFVAGAMTPLEFRRVEKLMDGCQATSASAKPASTRGAGQANHGCSVDASIEQDIALGKQVPVQSTPTFVIYHKGQRYPPGSGVVSWPLMKQFLDQIMTQ